MFINFIMIALCLFFFIGRSDTLDLKEFKIEMDKITILKNMDVEWFPMFFTVKDGKGNLVEGARVIIELSKGKISFLTNKNGKCDFFLDKNIFNSKAVIYAEKEGIDTLIPTMKLAAYFTTKSIDKIEQSKEIIPLSFESIDDKEVLKNGNLSVYYPAGKEAEGKKVLSILKKENNIIKNIIGIEPSPFGVLLSNKENPIITEENIWPVSLKAKNIENSYYWIITHEWTEGIVTGSYGEGIISYKNDPYTRWIGDGLAQYTAHKTTEILVPDSFPKWLSNRLHYFEEPIRQNREYFNLLQWKAHAGPEPGDIMMKEIIGYPVCEYFWLKLAERVGQDKIREFVLKAKQISNPTNKELIPLLSEITGMDIEKELTHIELDNVYNYYKKLSERMEK